MTNRRGLLFEATVASGAVALFLWPSTSWLWVVMSAADRHVLADAKDLFVLPALSVAPALLLVVIAAAFGRRLLHALEEHRISAVVVVLIGATLGACLETLILQPTLTMIMRGALVGAAAAYAQVLVFQASFVQPSSQT